MNIPSMTSRMPPFKSIEAFVLAARSLSFTEAASALHITVPAVSRRIQALETELGVPLFERQHRGLSLTDVGEAYFSNLEPAIDAIRRASHCVRVTARSRSVRVSLPASLAANWLVPRLQSFYAKHRDIDVQLDSAGEYPEPESAASYAALTNGQTDILIRLGSANWPGLRSARLLDIEAFPVCCPSFRADSTELSTADGMARLPLLGIRGQPELWLEWFRNAGVGQDPHIGQEFDNLHLLYRAAACGLGIALGLDVLVQPYMDGRQLVRAFNSQFKLSKSYYLLCRAADASRRPTSTFRDWLLAQRIGEVECSDAAHDGWGGSGRNGRSIIRD